VLIWFWLILFLLSLYIYTANGRLFTKYSAMDW
jgi:hypothetical protein